MTLNREPRSRQQKRDAFARTLAAAEQRYEENADCAATVWFGRVLGFGNQFDRALKVYSDGLEKFPDSFELLRQRGHRYISIREFDLALADLSRAAELIDGLDEFIEPDGIDNELPVPPTSIQFNVYYHYGLALYLSRQWEGAAAVYRQCLEWIKPGNHDELTGITQWLYCALQRMGEQAEADALVRAIPSDLDEADFDEGPSYYHCIKVYTGEQPPESLLEVGEGDQPVRDQQAMEAVQFYALGNYWLCNGERDKAVTMFERCTDLRRQGAFGVIAAEVELAAIRAGNA